MADRENVIKGIIHHKLRHKSMNELNHDECFDCPYRPNGKSMCDSIEPMLDDILELLKEQEPAPVIQRKAKHMLFRCCGSCGMVITDGDKFCRNCGKGLKWG